MIETKYYLFYPLIVANKDYKADDFIYGCLVITDFFYI